MCLSNSFCVSISSTASVKLPPEKFINKNDTSSAEMESKTVVLNSSDELFAELRDKNFSGVGYVVSRKAKTITAQFDVSRKGF